MCSGSAGGQRTWAVESRLCSAQGPICSLTAFLGSSGAQHSPGQCAPSARQGGRRSLTAAGRGLAPAAYPEEAAKVTSTELSDCSSCSQARCKAEPKGKLAQGQTHGMGTTSLTGAHSPSSVPRPRRAAPEGTKDTSPLCLISTGSQGGPCFIWLTWCLSEI